VAEAELPASCVRWGDRAGLIDRSVEWPAFMRLSVERAFRLVAIVEATSFLLLLAATYVKYGHDEPVGVQILGPVHGALFVAYVGLALSLASRESWSLRTTALVLAGGVVPAGGYAVDRWLSRQFVAAPSNHSPVAEHD
jgi:integral membrane protein